MLKLSCYGNTHILGLFSLALCDMSLNLLLSEYEGRNTVAIIRNLSVHVIVSLSLDCSKISNVGM
jgi:hypothetical protein